jgi:hypothetical protein
MPMRVIASTSITDVSPRLLAVVVPLSVAAIGVIGIVIGATLARWAEATNRRRDSFAAAVQTLAAWVEFPYRIRRRTSDSPEELGRLAGLGHDLQEHLRCHLTWIAAESPRLGGHYRRAVDSVSGLVGPASQEAWKSPPITQPSQMVLGPWGPGGACQTIIEDFQRALTWRFGWRRVIAPLLRLAGRDPYAAQDTSVTLLHE